MRSDDPARNIEAGEILPTELLILLFPAVRVALDLAHENNYGGGASGREAYCRCILDQILTGYEGIDAEDLAYLQNRLPNLVEART